MTVELSYTIQLRPEPEGGYTVLVPALPEIVTYGIDEKEALRMAHEAIALALEVRREDGEVFGLERMKERSRHHGIAQVALQQDQDAVSRHVRAPPRLPRPESTGRFRRAEELELECSARAAPIADGYPRGTGPR